jgi:autotransporter-associated beta strand protein
VFSTNNTYSGATTLTAGTLEADSTSALSPNSAFTVNSILDLNGFSNTIGSLSGAATGIVTNNGPRAAALKVGSDIDTTFAGKLENGTNALELIKSGAGTLTLTGDSTIAGTTIIAGRLQLGNGGLLADYSPSGFKPLRLDRSGRARQTRKPRNSTSDS